MSITDTQPHPTYAVAPPHWVERKPVAASEGQTIDLGGPDGGRYWRITQASGPYSAQCAWSAAVMARCTGSVGATESLGALSDNDAESLATVAQLDALAFRNFSA